MRMRKKKNTPERLERNAHFLIQNAEALRADPAAVFDARRPLRLEIGCGKGAFIAALSRKQADYNYFAMEKISDVLALALEKNRIAHEKTQTADNLRFILGDAKDLPLYFPPESLETIYINFCDPWPKKGYAKRRLTYTSFLEIYHTLLVPGGEIRFKTDNRPLFDFSVEMFEASPFEITMQTNDLHGSAFAEGNIMTEYEKLFSEQGVPINALVAVKK